MAAATSAGKEGQLLLEGRDEEQQQLQQQQPQPQIGNIKVKLAVKEDSKIEVIQIKH